MTGPGPERPVLARRVRLLALLLAGSAPLAAAGGRFPGDAAVARELRGFVEVHRGAPGVVVGLIDAAGRRVIAFGESGRRERPGLDGATRFEIGSITKTFTGVLFAEMLLAGEVSEEQKVASLFPSEIPLENGIEAASLEELATHATGLPRIGADLRSASRVLSRDPYRGTTAGDVFRAVSRVPRARLRPTETLAYSNLGYALLGRLLERRAGVPYEELLRRRVLAPLGLGGIATAHGERASDLLARGHGPGGRPVPYWHVDGYAPAGSLVASADDLLDYVALQLAATDPAVAEAQRRRRSFPDGTGIGLGWMHATIGGQRWIWHDGGTGGFRSFAGFQPDEGSGLIVLANGQGDVDALARRVIDPALPPPPAHVARPSSVAITLLLIAWAPLIVAQSVRLAVREARARSRAPALPSSAAPVGGLLARRRPHRPRIDRLDLLRRPLSPAIALVLAERLGAWLDLPFAAWWVSLALTALAYVALLERARALPWRRPGRWSAIGRGLVALLEAAVLALLFW